MKEIGGASLRLETDFFRKRNNRTVGRQKAIRSLQVRATHLFLALLIISVLALGVYQAGRHFADWELFQVAEFRLLNQPEMEQERIAEILAGCRGNIFMIDLTDLRRKLADLQTVQDVIIRRDLPAALELTFLIRQPFFQLREKGGLVSFDEEGVELFSSAAVDPDLLQVRDTDRADLERVFVLKKELAGRRDRISFVSFRPGLGLVVKLKTLDELLYLGKDFSWNKIDDYLRIKEKLPFYFKGIRYADLRLSDRVYFEPLEGGDAK